MLNEAQNRQASDALSQIEDVMLTAMWKSAVSSEWGDVGCAFGFRFFDPLPREITRGVLRNLRAKGMVVYVNALWDDNGEPRGAGYALTDKAAAEFRRMEEEQREVRRQERWEWLSGS